MTFQEKMDKLTSLRQNIEGQHQGIQKESEEYRAVLGTFGFKQDGSIDPLDLVKLIKEVSNAPKANLIQTP